MSHTPHAPLGDEFAPAELRDRVARTYRMMFESDLPLADEGLRRRRRELLGHAGVAAKLRYELVRDYERDELPTRDRLRRATGDDVLHELLGGTLLKFPHLYAHQADALEQALAPAPQRHDLLLTTGTGSGKTETMLSPIFARLAAEAASWPAAASPPEPWWQSSAAAWHPQRSHEERPAAMRGLVLYPMNALVEDQLIRLRQALDHDDAHAFYRAHGGGNPIYFGRYTGRTEGNGTPPQTPSGAGPARQLLSSLEEERTRLLRGGGDAHRWRLPRPGSSEMLLRWDMQAHPPDLLITNFAMLNIMLLRSYEDAIFERTREWLDGDPSRVFTLVVDELHAYRGSAGAEVGMVIRSLCERLGLLDRPDQLHIIAASASLRPDDPDGARFLQSFFGRKPDRFVAVDGTFAPLPDPPRHVDWERVSDADTEDTRGPAAGDALERSGAAAHLAHLLDAGEKTPVRDEDDVRDAVGGEERLDQTLRVVQRAGAHAGVRLRAHLFFRPTGGVWACSSPDCPDSEPGSRIGRLYPVPRYHCSAPHPRSGAVCGARVLELLCCRACGTAMLGGYHAAAEHDDQPNHGAPRPRGNELHLVPEVARIEDLPERATLDKTGATYRVYCPEPVPDLPTMGSSKRQDVDFYRATYDPANGTLRLSKTSLEDGDRGVLFLPKANRGQHRPRDAELPAFPPQCPACHIDWMGNRPLDDPEQHRSPVARMRLAKSRPVQAAATEAARMLHDAGSAKTREGVADAAESARKLLIFSDSRQQAAEHAAGIERYHYTDLVRALTLDRLHEANARRSRADELARAVEEGEHINLDEAIDELGARERLVLDYTRNGQRASELATELRRIAEGSVTLDDVVGRVRRGLLGLHTDPAGGAVRYEHSAGTWASLVDWQANPPDWDDHTSGTSERDATDKADSALTAEVLRALFAGGGKDIESRGLARAFLRLDASGGETRSDEGCEIVRRLAIRKRLYHAEFNERNEREKDDPPSHLRDLLSRLGHREPDEAACLREALNEHGWLVHPDGLRLRVPRDDEEVWRCERCGSKAIRAHEPTACLAAHCPETRFRRLASPTQEDDLAVDYHHELRDAARHDRLQRLRCAELTGQTEPLDALSRQAHFQGAPMLVRSGGGAGREYRSESDALDALSVTTTMEAGVDVGDLRAVVLANVPPQRFNYQQRSGRAGRRDHPLSLSVTVCRTDSSHDETHFADLDLMTREVPPAPAIDVDREPVLARSARALVLRAAFVEVRSQLEDEGADIEWTSNVHGHYGTVEDWRPRLRSRVAAWCQAHGQHTARHAVRTVATQTPREDDAERLADTLSANLVDDIDQAVRGAGPQTPLSQRLAEQGLLPMFGFPTHLVEFHTDFPKRNRFMASWPPPTALTRTEEIAITEFAPGSELVKDKFVYTAAGFVHAWLRPGDRTVDLAPADSPDRILGPEVQTGACEACFHIEVTEGADELRGDACPRCGAAATDDPDTPGWVTRRTRRPRGYTTATYGQRRWRPYDDRPPRRHRGQLRTRLRVHDVDNGSVAAGEDGLPAQVRGVEATLYTLHERDIVPVVLREKSKGSNPQWHGGIFDQDALQRSGVGSGYHEELPEVQPFGLMGQRRTQALILTPNHATRLAPSRPDARGALASLGFLMRKAAATHVLDVEPNEMQVGLLPQAPADDVRGNGAPTLALYLADTLENGAGYASHLASTHGWRALETALRREAEALKSTEHRQVCDSSCYRACLRDHSNVAWHALLDWRAALRVADRLLDLDLSGDVSSDERAHGKDLADALGWQDPETFDSEDGVWQLLVPREHVPQRGIVVAPSAHSEDLPTALQQRLESADHLSLRRCEQRFPASPLALGTYRVVSSFEVQRQAGLLVQGIASNP